ncbi:MAG TPA: arsenite S-adenosylmethyltransferase [Flavobacteriales bacterium]|jgi:arsenite methyltransferase|nr:arsenite S-adenosylmethyltransferase [Flavobacteriales bacterium]
MSTQEKIKEVVRDKYSSIARNSNSLFGPGCSCCSSPEQKYNLMQDSYVNIDGHYHEADLGLGCGLPTEYALLKAGHTVLDLGSGAGNDVFVARSIVGSDGRVIGLDFSKDMVKKAKKNVQKLGYKNVEFIQGDIESIPLDEGSIDVVISNCVLNLVPDKVKVFSEIHRVLRHEGHFSISDIVIEGDLPENIRRSAELYVGCVAGAIKKEEYMQYIANQGFKEVSIQKEKPIDLPDELLLEHLSQDVIDAYRQSGVRVVSITVFGKK